MGTKWNRTPAGRAYQREYARKLRESERGQAYRQSEVYKAAQRAYKKDPQKVLARNAVLIELRAGRLVRPDACACGQSPVQAHHHKGYEQENWLEIEWICSACHARTHLEQDRTRRRKLLNP